MRWIVILLLLAVACGGAGDGGAGGGGEPGFGGAGGSSGGGALAPEVRVVRWEDGRLLPVNEGSTIPLVLAPQGGHFVWVAGRARNLAGRDVEMNAAVVDVATGAAIGSAVARPLMTRGADGFWDPEHETFTTLDMVQICPRDVGFDLDRRPVKLTIEVKDLTSKLTGSASVEVIPDCGGNAACACECAADFTGTCG